MKKHAVTICVMLLLLTALTSCGNEPLFTKLSDTSSSSVSRLDSEASSALSDSSDSFPSEESSKLPQVDPYLGKPVPEGTKQEESYFDDAVFVGDSLTAGLGAYQVIDSSKVIASTGINPQTILTKSCIEQPGGGTLTALEAVKAASPRKIYVMLGSNGVAFLTQENILDFYGKFVDQLKEAFPDSILYVQSVLPVTKAKETEDDRYSNKKIDALNEALLTLSQEKGAYYLNVAEAVKDENGCLPADGSGDGMHFGVSTYRVWTNYLLSHTVDTTKLP